MLALGRHTEADFPRTSRWISSWQSAVWILLVLASSSSVLADVYMHNPRGSNNKLTEQSNNAQNNNRLFDSQNNNAGGYQVGDRCIPNCKNGNQYDPTKDGAMQGIMYYYHGSELHVEWTSQHGCGTPGTNTDCQVILQYMCNSDFPGVRDGKDPDNGRRRRGGGDAQNPEGANRQAADEPSRGRHEHFDFYDACRKRQRNKGLYTADQKLNDNKGAAATRQNRNGNRRGLECPEERDYYPYWHDTPWRDIVVYTSDPKRCEWYRSESQNVKSKGYCLLETPGDETTLPREKQVPNQPDACKARGGVWLDRPAWDIPAPECLALPESRDNHLGNINNGQMMSYPWKIPDSIPDGDHCVLRIRYNISSGDFDKHPSSDSEDWDPWHDLDWRYNDDGAPLKGDPIKDFVGAGNLVSGPLQLQVNTAQFGRTFEDRSHVFRVQERPSDVSWYARIVNFNVRGRRGNIVQVYPSVEYDFVPADIKVSKGDYLHFQWTGSDANSNGNDGNGKAGTDRSNLVQIKDRSSNTPLPWTEHSLFFTASGQATHARSDSTDSGTVLARQARPVWNSDDGPTLVSRFAFLDQHFWAPLAGLACPDTYEEAVKLNDNDDNNCQQLNAAPAYFDGGLVEMAVIGEHHIASTRNNDFTNRSHKATIFVGWRIPYWWEVLILVVVGVLLGTLSYMSATALYAYLNPMSNLFSRSHRPYLLRLPCLRKAVAEKEGQRKQYRDMLAAAWRKHCVQVEGSETKGVAIGKHTPLAPPAGTAQLDTSPTVESEHQGSSDFTLPPKWFHARSVVSGKASPEEATEMRRCKCLCANPRSGRSTSLLKCCRDCTAGVVSCLASCFGGEEWHGHRAFVCLNIFVGLMGVALNLFGGFNRWYTMAKCGGYLLDFNLSVLLIPTMRSIQTFAREVRALDALFNSDPIGFHIHVAKWVAFSTCIHIVGHALHMMTIASTPIYLPAITTMQKMSGKTYLGMIFDPLTRAAPFTGAIIFVLMASMYLSASSRVRRQTFNLQKCPRTIREIIAWLLLLGVCVLLAPFLLFWLLYRRVFQGLPLKSCWPSEDKIGGFRIFWSVHQNWLPVYVLLLLHGPQCWIWFLWPLILLICDRLVSRERRRAQIALASAELLKGKVMKLVFNLPAGFVYQAGQYVQLCCDQVTPTEWHPFTLTSCPEEGQLSVHIRCPDDLDWCAELRRRLLEKPVMVLSGNQQKPEAGCRVTYKPYSQPMAWIGEGAAIQGTRHELFSQPKLVEILSSEGIVVKKYGDEGAAVISKAPWWSRKQDATDDDVMESGRLANVSLSQILQPSVPRDAVRIRLDGPHGAPSELVWRHRVVMLVGAGIGVTPFASILRSIQLRRTANREMTKQIRRQGSDKADKALLDWRPCEHVHFYWLCRSQDEFDWFYDLLQSAVDGPAKDQIEVNLFQTGEVELTKVKTFGCGFRQFMGRPNWSRIFPSVAAQHPGENIGVFLCGPAVLRGELQKGAAGAMEKDAAETTFTVHAENF